MKIPTKFMQFLALLLHTFDLLPWLVPVKAGARSFLGLAAFQVLRPGGERTKLHWGGVQKQPLYTASIFSLLAQKAGATFSTNDKQNQKQIRIMIGLSWSSRMVQLVN